MDREKDYWHFNRASTEHFIEVCANPNDFVDEPVSPVVEEFLQAMVQPYIRHRDADGEHWKVMPDEVGFQMDRFLMVLRMKGKCEFDPDYSALLKYILPNLLSLDKDQLKEVYLAIPGIVRAAFSVDFAQDFERVWDENLKHWGYKEDLPTKTVDEIDPVTDTITSVQEAKSLLIDYAKEKVVAFDWSWALGGGVEEADIAHLFEVFYPPILNQISLAPVMVIFHAEQDTEALSNLPDEQKLDLGDQKTLALLCDSINPKVAGFIRDQLCIQVTDEIGERLGVDIAAGKLLITNPGLQQAMERSFRYFELGRPAG